jgi:hypothetical protein
MGMEEPGMRRDPEHLGGNGKGPLKMQIPFTGNDLNQSGKEEIDIMGEGRHTTEDLSCVGPMRRRILILDDQGAFAEDFMDYAVHLAERLNYDLLVLTTDAAREGDRFVKRAAEAVSMFKQKAAIHHIDCEAIIKKGDLERAIVDVKEKEKRIGFVLVDANLDRKNMAEYVPFPLFSVVSQQHPIGGNVMADKTTHHRKKLALKTAGFGLVTAILYAAVFTQADLVMHYFTRGGWYAALPVTTVFAFSFAHGGFAGNLWSLLGIEAVHKTALREVERKVVRKQQKIARKPRMYAYINPFHRL